MVVHWFDFGWHGMGLNLGEPKLNFPFAKISFGMKVKGQGNPSNQGGWKAIIEWPLNDNLL